MGISVPPNYRANGTGTYNITAPQTNDSPKYDEYFDVDITVNSPSTTYSTEKTVNQSISKPASRFVNGLIGMTIGGFIGLLTAPISIPSMLILHYCNNLRSAGDAPILGSDRHTQEVTENKSHPHHRTQLRAMIFASPWLWCNRSSNTFLSAFKK